MRAVAVITSPLTAMQMITSALHIDFLEKAADWLLEHATGFNMEAVHNWAANLGQQLYTCINDAYKDGNDPYRHYNPHCWVWYDISVYHVRVPFAGWTLFTYEEINYKTDGEVKFCPTGPDYCVPL
jgi:hypothetical protein